MPERLLSTPTPVSDAEFDTRGLIARFSVGVVLLLVGFAILGAVLREPVESAARVWVDTTGLAGMFAAIAVLDSVPSPVPPDLFTGFAYVGGLDFWTIAVVASLETLLCVEATDKLDPQQRVTPTNRELLAQGVGNTVSGLIGGLPITQVIVRSSANIQTGNATKMSAILHGAWLMVFFLLAPTLLTYIPLGSLAAVLFVVGYKLAKPANFKKMFDSGMAAFIPFVVTILAIVFIDLLKGLGIGLVVALACSRLMPDKNQA